MATRTEDASPMSVVQAFAEELKAQREASGLTQEQLAGRMGARQVTRPQVKS
jgi:ribosome-binding protein aMBF1 (putative translation factor)